MYPYRSRVAVSAHGVVLALLVIAMLALAGCGNSSSSKPPAPPKVGKVDYKFMPEVIYLDRATKPSPIVSQAADTMVLRGKPAGLKVGSILVSNIGAGALRKVTAISQVGSDTRVTTKQAVLTDAFEKLDMDVPLPWGPQLGTPKSSVPGVSMRWAPAPADSRAVGSSLEVKVGGVALSTQSGLTFDGKGDFIADPRLKVIIDRGTNLIVPKVTYFLVGGNYRVWSRGRLESEFGGSLSFVKDLGEFTSPPLMAGPVPITLDVGLSAKAAGSAAGKLGADIALGFDADGRTLWQGDPGFNTDPGWVHTWKVTPRSRATFDQVENSAQVSITPIEAEVAVRLFGVVGATMGLGTSVGVTAGQHVDEDGVEGIKATVGAGVGFEVGLSAKSKIENIYEVSWKPATYTHLVVDLPLYEKFWPYPAVDSAITVGDDGNIPDDVFRVSLDGIVLGQTTTGGTGQFRVGALRPGTHDLQVECIEADDNVGTVGISLANGLTFADGSTTLSDTLSLGEVANYDVDVPAVAKRAAAAPLRANTYMEGGG